MRLRRISEKLVSDYKKKKTLALICAIVSFIALIVLFTLTTAGVLYKVDTLFIYIPMGILLYVSMKYLSWFFSLVSRRSVVLGTGTVLPVFIEIDEKGITADISKESGTEERLFTWDELTEISGSYLDLSFGRNNKSKYKIAFITNGQKRKATDAELGKLGLIKMRKALKERQKQEKRWGLEINPSGVLVEMYDELVEEVKKYWKKDKDNI